MQPTILITLQDEQKLSYLDRDVFSLPRRCSKNSALFNLRSARCEIICSISQSPWLNGQARSQKSIHKIRVCIVLGGITTNTPNPKGRQDSQDLCIIYLGNWTLSICQGSFHLGTTIPNLSDWSILSTSLYTIEHKTGLCKRTAILGMSQNQCTTKEGLEIETNGFLSPLDVETLHNRPLRGVIALPNENNFTSLHWANSTSSLSRPLGLRLRERTALLLSDQPCCYASGNLPSLWFMISFMPFQTWCVEYSQKVDLPGWPC